MFFVSIKPPQKWLKSTYLRLDWNFLDDDDMVNIAHLTNLVTLGFMCRTCADLTYRSRNRSVMEVFGHTSRQIEDLHRQIKRWTWRGRSTRKVRKLHALERKMSGISPQVSAQFARIFHRDF